MLLSATAALRQGAPATDLTALLKVSPMDACTVVCRMPFNGTGDGVAVRIGSAGVSQTSGYTLDINAPSQTVKLEAGDKLYASYAGGSQGAAQLDVLAYTSS